MLTCGCGRWMHTEGVDECFAGGSGDAWLVRSECRACRVVIGCEAAPDTAVALVDRMIWSDDARHALDRMPPYVAPLVRADVETYARAKGQTVITMAILGQARQGGAVAWAPEAERRLDNVPAPIRAMARLELERTAIDRGAAEVTVGLMEEVKARYFGMGASKRDG